MPDESLVRAGDSLLTGRGTQLSLVGELDEAGLPNEAYARLEESGRFTGERLFSSNPKLYRAVARLLARGLMTYREIAEVCEVSVNTVCGIGHREGITIETIRESLGRLGFDVSRLSLEAMRDRLTDPEELKKISAKDLAVMHGVATQNAQLMVGGATSRIDHGDQSPPSHDDYWNAVKPALPTGSTAANPALKERVPGAIEIETTTLPAAPADAALDAQKPPTSE